MGEIKRIDGLDIEEDLRFQRRTWAVQRAGWSGMALLILAACLGVLGPGPLSRARAVAERGALTLDYNRFERRHSPMELRVAYSPEAVHDGRLRLRMNYDYLRAVKIEGIEPEPERVEPGPDGVVFIFRVEEPRSGGRVVFHLEGNDAGRVEGRLAAGTATARFSQMLLP